ncbi:hypothetical protein RRG08_064580 [Elysia crispata]|uniref:Uncharacterized protein n=1 Tax=Elysia crispata TaxID=231223 RepID=A0AAE1BAI4_9GAST|nr:hypothetical protein RRG08_064580 [Elysia crispata]
MPCGTEIGNRNETSPERKMAGRATIRVELEELCQYLFQAGDVIDSRMVNIDSQYLVSKSFAHFALLVLYQVDKMNLHYEDN